MASTIFQLFIPPKFPEVPLSFSAAIWLSELIVPVDVSLWIKVRESNWPVASFLSTSSARIGEPHSTCNASASFPQRAFHHAPRRRGAEVNELFGGKQRLQLRLHFRVKIFEALPAMPNHWRTECLESFVADFDRSRNV